jgi:hypothetical protein
MGLRLLLCPGAQALVLGDFEGDGRLDLAALVPVASHEVRTLFFGPGRRMLSLCLVAVLDRVTHEPLALVLDRDEEADPSESWIRPADPRVCRFVSHRLAFVGVRGGTDSTGFWWDSRRAMFGRYDGLGQVCGC